MDDGRIFIADLSVGRIGRDISMLLGATLIGKFALAALSRSDQRPDERRDFYCYVDEFPMFTTASIDIILSEARKYRLSLILAMQYLDQLDTKLLGAVLGNVGNLVVFPRCRFVGRIPPHETNGGTSARSELRSSASGIDRLCAVTS